ncbi:MAG: hypothetical protein LUG62_06140, partial [Clostridiales bacterium]|nr:hypothetical protein [Clostridiales bacterium]
FQPIQIICIGNFYPHPAVRAAFTDSVTVANHISTGDIRISLEEYEEKNGREILYENPKTVLPGDTVSKIPRITCEAEDCWVRVKISYTDNLNGLEGLGDENLGEIPEKWEKIGEYFYYTEILGYGESADLFHWIHIPEDWTEEWAEKKLSMEIRAEAIQAANYTPDFTAMSPWGNEEIQKCIHTVDGMEASVPEKKSLMVEFNGDAHRLLAVPDDFFSNFARAMPGDTLRDTAQIRNTTDSTAEIFFQTSPECLSVSGQDLAEKLGLTISMDGKELYSGNLLAEELNAPVSLVTLAPGEEGELEFVISLPAGLDNAYALREADVKWIFSVNEDSPTQTPETNPEDGESGGSGTAREATSVKTGDETNIRLYFLLFLLAGVCGVTTLIRKGGGKK